MKTLIHGLFALACVACSRDDLLTPIPVDDTDPGAATAPEGRPRDGPGREIVAPDGPSTGTVPEETDPFDSPCEADEFVDFDGNCYSADEIPGSCDDIDIVLHSGTDPRISADEEGPMVVLNAADGTHLYGKRWDGGSRFDGQWVSSGTAFDIQRADDGRFIIPIAKAGTDDLLFVDEAGQVSSYSLLPAAFGRLQAADGMHLLAQRLGNGRRDLAFADSVGDGDVDVLGEMALDFLDVDGSSATVHALSVNGNVWVYDDWTETHVPSEQAVRYALTVWVHDRDIQGFTGVSVYEETAPAGTKRFAQANAIVHLDGRFAVAWQRGNGASQDESFLSIVFSEDGSLSPLIMLAVDIEDMVAGENGELLAVAVDRSSKPKRVRLLRIDDLGVMIEDRVVAEVDDAYAPRLIHAAGRTALTWSTEPDGGSDDGLVHLLILCPE